MSFDESIEDMVRWFYPPPGYFEDLLELSRGTGSPPSSYGRVSFGALMFDRVYTQPCFLFPA